MLLKAYTSSLTFRFKMVVPDINFVLKQRLRKIAGFPGQNESKEF